jgi:hypothetical protein
MLPAPLAAWHRIVETNDPSLLGDLLDDEAVFRSPAVHTPQKGRALATAYLSAAMVVLGPTLRYRRQWHDDTSAVLEFESELDGLTIHGVDMIQWNAAGKVVEFTVMIRPFRALERVIAHMGAELQRASAAK